MKPEKGIVWIPILIMVVSVAAFATMAVLVWNKSKNQDSGFLVDLSKPAVQHVVKNVNSSTNANVNTADDNKALADADLASKWIVFTDDVHGVSVQYPSTWKSETTLKQNDESGSSAAGLAWFFRPGSDGEVAAGSPTVFLKFLTNPDNKTLGQLLDADYDNCVASPGGTEEICINSKAITTWTSSTLLGHVTLRSGLLHLAAGSPSSIIEKEFLYVKTDDGYLVLDAFPEPGYETVVDRIISSLQFVDAQKTWVSYENKELGFSFRYPSVFGPASYIVTKPEDRPGYQTGKIFFVSMSAGEAPLTLGGITPDYGYPSEGSFLTTQGYVLDNGKYYNTFVADKDYKSFLLEPQKILQVGGQKIILLNQESVVSERNQDPNNSYPPTFGNDKLGALANFLKKSDFRGMGILDGNTALLPQTVFETILSTFQFTPTP